MSVNLQAALDGLTEAGKAIAGDSQAALAALQAFVDGLRVDTANLLDAAATALATGQDVTTWTNSLKAQVDAVALRTLRSVRELDAATGEKIKAAALGAFQTAIRLVVGLPFAPTGISTIEPPKP